MGWQCLHGVLNNRFAPILRRQLHPPRRELLLGLAARLLQGKRDPLAYGTCVLGAAAFSCWKCCRFSHGCKALRQGLRDLLRAAARQVRLASQEARDGNIFVQCFPVQTASAQLHLGPLLRAGI